MGVINAFPSGTKEGYDHHVEITTSQTWTVPAGVTEIVVRLFGGGGSGAVGSAYKGGGGGGHMAYAKLSVTPGTSYEIIIGSGGQTATVPVSSNDNSGNKGGITKFGDILSASGGDGGSSNGTGGDGGSGGGAGGGTHSYDRAAKGGDATYGGGGGNATEDVTLSRGGVYGGGGGNYTYVSQNGFESIGGHVANEYNHNYHPWPNDNGMGGGGGYKANGGNGYVYNSTSSVPYYQMGGGGGGGWEGGDGGNAVRAYYGGGGGGYGTLKLAGDGIGYDSVIFSYGGLGYGAGGGAGVTKGGAGAPGICIIEY